MTMPLLSSKPDVSYSPEDIPSVAEIAGEVRIDSSSDRKRQPVPFLARGLTLRLLIYVQIACQLILISGAGSIPSIRPLIRTVSFAASLLLLLFIPRTHASRNHPAWIPALGGIGIVVVALFHPLTDGWVAGIAHALMYVAIFSPLFWVSRLQLTAADLRKLFVILWLYYSLSATVGVLQFAFPGYLQPALSSSYNDQPIEYVEGLMVSTVGGEMVYRPMGLTDSPAGAATGGFYTILLGLGLLLTTRSKVMKTIYLTSMGVAMACLYLAQVRSVLIETALVMITLAVILIRRGRVVQVIIVTCIGAVVIGFGFLLAYKLGGETATERLDGLFSDDPGGFYYDNRGRFLESTVNELLPEMPMGAGLGRWGMMNNYFGNPQDNLYVELQWTGWLIDGGLPLIFCYVVALLLALRVAWKVAMARGDRIWVWGAIVFSYNLAACAATFNYPFFMSQSGLELWLLNAALFATAQKALPSLTAKARAEI